MGTNLHLVLLKNCKTCGRFDVDEADEFGGEETQGKA